jgi:hypothetical protein
VLLDCKQIQRDLPYYRGKSDLLQGQKRPMCGLFVFLDWKQIDRTQWTLISSGYWSVYKKIPCKEIKKV